MLKPATFYPSTPKMNRVISNNSYSVARARHMYSTIAGCCTTAAAAPALPQESYWAVRFNLPFLQFHFHEHNIYALKILIPFFRPASKFRKATISFVKPVRPSVRKERLDSHWTDFHEILHFTIYRET